MAPTKNMARSSPTPRPKAPSRMPRTRWHHPKTGTVISAVEVITLLNCTPTTIPTTTSTTTPLTTAIPTTATIPPTTPLPSILCPQGAVPPTEKRKIAMVHKLGKEALKRAIKGHPAKYRVNKRVREEGWRARQLYAPSAFPAGCKFIDYLPRRPTPLYRSENAQGEVSVAQDSWLADHVWGYCAGRSIVRDRIPGERDQVRQGTSGCSFCPFSTSLVSLRLASLHSLCPMPTPAGPPNEYAESLPIPTCLEAFPANGRMPWEAVHPFKIYAHGDRYHHSSEPRWVHGHVRLNRARWEGPQFDSERWVFADWLMERVERLWLAG
ncbi:hypothetical protein EJ06DRAFT_327364 [Trichodelitschia bisporula]|uniref:Uncharacterized protein n=1 Tax=Trichodelitschia bisporula TaxID=703511 RepID=A0A6G1I242_9PEZI|nr:hypothetical protein EJ06DRAFT_327364 [Trichodelitschia bisporula]